MKRVFGIITAALVVCAAGTFFGWRAYQNHLSTPLRRTLTAAMDPNATIADFRQYLHEARPLVRTRKDAELLDEVQQAFQMAEEADQTSEEYANYLQTAVEDGAFHRSQFWKLEDIEEGYRRDGIPEPAGLKTQIDDALQQEKLDAKLWDERAEEAKLEQKRAEDLFTKIRAELGLPVLSKAT
jgi:hypothetical protein